MNTVFLALSLLSSITGFASGYYYETTEECLYDCYFEHFGCSSLSFKESMISVEDAFDMDGANKFLLINYIDGQTDYLFEWIAHNSVAYPFLVAAAIVDVFGFKEKSEAYEWPIEKFLQAETVDMENEEGWWKLWEHL